MSLGGGASSALDTAVANAIAAGVTFAVAAGNEQHQRVQRLARARRRRRSPSARRPTPTPARRSPTSARAWTSSRRARTSRRPGARATPPRTRSAARRWPRRTSRARRRYTCRSQPDRRRRAGPRRARRPTRRSARSSSPGTGSPNALLFLTLRGHRRRPAADPAAGRRQRAAQPGLRARHAVWIQYSSGGYPLVDETRPRSGIRSVYFAGYNSANESIGQTVTVPANGDADLLLVHDVERGHVDRVRLPARAGLHAPPARCWRRCGRGRTATTATCGRRTRSAWRRAPARRSGSQFDEHHRLLARVGLLRRRRRGPLKPRPGSRRAAAPRATRSLGRTRREFEIWMDSA